MKNEISATRNVALGRVERALRDFMQQPKFRSCAGVGELAATFNQISEDHEQCIPAWVRWISKRHMAPEQTSQLLTACIENSATAVNSKDPHTLGPSNAKGGFTGRLLSDLVSAIDAKDHYTRHHSEAVSRLAAQIARQLGLPDTQVEDIRLGGILHDIGKIGVPEAVLNKPSLLTTDEYNLMKVHAWLGDKVLELLKSNATEGIRGIVRSHHEAYDGSGYPDRLEGEDIPLGARIVAVA